MKSLALITTLLFAFSALAVDKKPIFGNDAAEIFEAMTEKLGTEIFTYEQSPDAGCWKVSTTSLLGMLCEQAVCDTEKKAICFFEHVEENDLDLIRGALRYAELNPNNALFID